MAFAKWMLAGMGVAALGAATLHAQGRYADEPAYTSLALQGAFELREYQSMIVAEVKHKGDRTRAMQTAFRRLAAYIFARDDGRAPIGMTAPVIRTQADPIEMTTPVTNTQESAGEGWTTRFVMPPRYTMATLPEPPSDIRLVPVAARKMATVRFSGWGRDEDMALMERMLRRWMAEQELEAAGPAEYACYDAPRVPARLRRNEVMIPVK